MIYCNRSYVYPSVNPPPPPSPYDVIKRGTKKRKETSGGRTLDEGWSFIEPVDQGFIDTYPQLAKREAERWQAIAPWLEADPAAAAALQSPPAPAEVDPATCVKAQSLVLPIILKNGR